MSDNQKTNTQPNPSPQPFRGSEEIIKNLNTLPEGGDREDLLSQVAPEELATQPGNQPQNQPAPNKGGSNAPK